MGDTSVSENLSARIRRSLEDLAVLRQSLIAYDGRTEDLIQELDPELVLALKSCMDELGQLLGSYVQVLSTQLSQNPEQALRWSKMELLGELLRCVRPGANSLNAEHSGFERLVNNALAVSAQHSD